MARCPEVNSSGCEPPFLPPSFPQSGTEFAPPISNFYSEISFIFAVNVLYLSCDCRTRLKKRRKRVSFWGSSAIAAYPRKGTITKCHRKCSPFPLIAAYPRKGTITIAISIEPPTPDCSLSPQGDDNHMPRYICSTFPIAAYPRKGTITWTSSSRRRRKSLIAAYPRKGTITRRGLVCTDNHAIAAYPRKGTITQDEQSNQEHFDCSLSPQGDDNFTSIGSPHNLHRLQLIPARGR